MKQMMMMMTIAISSSGDDDDEGDAYWQGGESVELIPDGAEVEVNASNVHLYVQKYAERRMVRCQEKALKVSYHNALVVGTALWRYH